MPLKHKSSQTHHEFNFSPADFVPFRDTEVLERVRHISRDQIEQHSNPDFCITVMPDADVEFRWLLDMFGRIKDTSDAGEKQVLLLPNPYPNYVWLAAMINRFRVDCKKVWFFAMDEFANEHDQIAPIDWPQSLVGSMLKYLYANIDEDLRPPMKQVIGPNDQNIRDFGTILEDAGNADCVYIGPGWTGHLCFIEPTSPEFSAQSLDEWKTMGPRVNTLHPLSIAQQSLHGVFGLSGDVAAIPPKGATVGPAQIIAAKHRIDMHALSIHGTATTWQRLISRLVMHGPVTPLVPESILQTLRTDVWVSETIAANIEQDWVKGY